jgi:hypothetical protein
MDTGQIAIFIPILALSIGMVAVIGSQRIEREKLKLKQIEAAAVAGDAGTVTGAMAEIERLKQRVAVLEKLVTDDDRRLAEEISRLRGGNDARV